MNVKIISGIKTGFIGVNHSILREFQILFSFQFPDNRTSLQDIILFSLIL